MGLSEPKPTRVPVSKAREEWHTGNAGVNSNGSSGACLAAQGPASPLAGMS